MPFVFSFRHQSEHLYRLNICGKIKKLFITIQNASLIMIKVTIWHIAGLLFMAK